MSDDHRSSGLERGSDGGSDRQYGRGDERDGMDAARRVAPTHAPGPEETGTGTPVPEDLADTWNVPEKAWDREQTPVDTLGDISDEDLYRDAGSRPVRRSGV